MLKVESRGIMLNKSVGKLSTGESAKFSQSGKPGPENGFGVPSGGGASIQVD